MIKNVKFKMTKILLATNNQGKVERYRKIVKQINPLITLHTPKELSIEKIEVEENGTLEENAKKKAQAYFGKTNLPVIANDAGFFVKGKGLVKNPKRIALNSDEKNLTKEQIYELVFNYWRKVARNNGGEIDAAWVDAFALSMPDGNIYKEGARREVVLTDKLFGQPHIQFPIRALYISKTTVKPAINHTEEESFLEIVPIKEALSELIKKVVQMTDFC